MSGITSIEEIKSFGLSKAVEDKMIEEFLKDNPQKGKPKKVKQPQRPGQISAEDVQFLGELAKQQVAEQLAKSEKVDQVKPEDEVLIVNESNPKKIKRVKAKSKTEDKKDEQPFSLKQFLIDKESKLFAKMFPNVNKLVKFLESKGNKKQEAETKTSQTKTTNVGLTDINQNLVRLNSLFDSSLINSQRITDLLSSILENITGKKIGTGGTGGGTGGGEESNKGLLSKMADWGSSALDLLGIRSAAKTATSAISTATRAAVPAVTTGLAAIGGGSAAVGGAIVGGGAAIAGLSYLGSEAEKSGAAQAGRERVRKQSGSGLMLDPKEFGDLPSPASEEAQKLGSLEKAQAYIMSFAPTKSVMEKWLEVWEVVKDLPMLAESRFMEIVEQDPYLKNYADNDMFEYVRPLIEKKIIEKITHPEKNQSQAMSLNLKEADAHIVQKLAHQYLTNKYGDLTEKKVDPQTGRVTESRNLEGRLGKFYNKEGEIPLPEKGFEPTALKESVSKELENYTKLANKANQPKTQSTAEAIANASEYSADVQNKTPAATKVPSSPESGTNAATKVPSSPESGTNAATPSQPPATSMPATPTTGSTVSKASASYDQSKRPSASFTTVTSVPETGSGGGSSSSPGIGTSTSDPGNLEPTDAALRYKELFNLN